MLVADARSIRRRLQHQERHEDQEGQIVKNTPTETFAYTNSMLVTTGYGDQSLHGDQRECTLPLTAGAPDRQSGRTQLQRKKPGCVEMRATRSLSRGKEVERL